MENSSHKYFKKINLFSLNSYELNDKTINLVDKYDCLVIENYENDIEENSFIPLNHIKQLNKFLLVNSSISIKNYEIKLNDLKSRVNSFIDLYIDLPSDDLLRVVILKSFSDRQINLSNKNLEYILKNIERSYEKIFKFIKEVDNISLSTGKSININLIKKVLGNE